MNSQWSPFLSRWFPHFALFCVWPNKVLATVEVVSAKGLHTLKTQLPIFLAFALYIVLATSSYSGLHAFAPLPHLTIGVALSLFSSRIIVEGISVCALGARFIVCYLIHITVREPQHAHFIKTLNVHLCTLYCYSDCEGLCKMPFDPWHPTGIGCFAMATLVQCYCK